jgi:uncharacterized membrane protein (UPF0127 family)
MIKPRRPPRPRSAPVLLAVALLAACTQGREAENGPDGTAGSGLPRGTLVIEAREGEVRVSVEIAEAIEDQIRGLRFREHLPADAGMVFLHPDPEPQAFIMEDTLIPLSVAWWNADRRIVAIEDMEPCTGGVCPTYGPHGLTVGAVEVNQGFFEEHGVEVGDPVRLERAR